MELLGMEDVDSYIEARLDSALAVLGGLRNSIKTIIYMSQSIYYLHLYGSINIGFALLTKNSNLI